MMMGWRGMFGTMAVPNRMRLVCTAAAAYVVKTSPPLAPPMVIHTAGMPISSACLMRPTTNCAFASVITNPMFAIVSLPRGIDYFP